MSTSPSNSQPKWPRLLINLIYGVGTEITEEIHSMEQFFIKLYSIYAFICQMSLFILCDFAINDVPGQEKPPDKSIIVALNTILFYTVIGYIANKSRDFCRRHHTRATYDDNLAVSFALYFKWFCKIAMEITKAVVLITCLRDYTEDYEPTFLYIFITFTYYLCTEKIFSDLLCNLVEYLKIDILENLEYLYLPFILNSMAIIYASIIETYLAILKYSNFLLLATYFLIYLRYKDTYYNYWKAIEEEKKTYSSFKPATEQDIEQWDDVCAVCLSKMSKARITPCNHLFHPYCLKQCLKSSFNCPLCKQNFKENSPAS